MPYTLDSNNKTSSPLLPGRSRSIEGPGSSGLQVSLLGIAATHKRHRNGTHAPKYFLLP